MRLEQRATMAWGEGAWSVAVSASVGAELPGFLAPEDGSAPPTSLSEDVRAELAAWREQGCAVVCLAPPFAAGREEEEPVAGAGEAKWQGAPVSPLQSHPPPRAPARPPRSGPLRLRPSADPLRARASS